MSSSVPVNIAGGTLLFDDEDFYTKITNNFVNEKGDDINGPLNMNGNKINNLGEPLNENDCVNKTYTDNCVKDLKKKFIYLRNYILTRVDVNITKSVKSNLKTITNVSKSTELLKKKVEELENLSKINSKDIETIKDTYASDIDKLKKEDILLNKTDDASSKATEWIHKTHNLTRKDLKNIRRIAGKNKRRLDMFKSYEDKIKAQQEEIDQIKKDIKPFLNFSTAYLVYDEKKFLETIKK